jgi:prepilin-type N-terminal cleavage/methylation domain-containing protein/prepilin-type processing-associated H-X9-DG protein
MTAAASCRKGYWAQFRSAFTLVELLVVIGIIAVLMAILLPAMSRARKSAVSVKCASALRQVGMGFQAYANAERGFWPVARYSPTSGQVYALHGFSYTSTTPAYWFDFVADYVNQANLGYATATATDSQQARKGVLWGCPAWEAYAVANASAAGNAGGVSNVQPGYGMNLWPSFTADYPAAGVAFPKAATDEALIVGGLDPNPKNTSGKFYRMSEISSPSERCLCADSRFWAVESNPVPAASSYPPAIVPQSTYNNSNTYTPGINGQTMIDIYRHGTTPSGNSGATGAFNPNGGSISFNILYCDGHVGTMTDAKQAYLSTRQRFPN